MNVPDSWVKSVCEKLGIEEPQVEIGVFWDNGEDDKWYEHSMGPLTSTDDGKYECDGGCRWDNFKPLSPKTIASIKKDLGIE
jgi:hypothetical protein